MDAKSQVERFLGGYSASAAESAVSYVLSEENTPQFKKARRRIAQKLLDKPICELVSLPALVYWPVCVLTSEAEWG